MGVTYIPRNPNCLKTAISKFLQFHPSQKKKKTQFLWEAVNQLGCFGSCDQYKGLSVVLSFTAHFPFKTKQARSPCQQRAEELSWQMQALDMHEEASFKPQGVQKYFQSGLGDSYPVIYFRKRRTSRAGQDKLSMRWSGIGFRRYGCPCNKHAESTQGPTRSLMHTMQTMGASTQKCTDSTHTNTHRHTCKLSKSMLKSLRKIRVNSIQDSQILTTAHTLCWTLEIPNWSSRKETKEWARTKSHSPWN